METDPAAGAIPPLDALTAILSRTGLEQAVPRHPGVPSWVFILDIDRFRAINHHVGRAAGDRILAVAGNAVRRSVRAGDLVGRVGGDHFAVVLAIASEIDAQRVALRVRRSLSAALSPMPEMAGLGGRLSINVGLCEFGWADTCAANVLARLAMLLRPAARGQLPS